MCKIMYLRYFEYLSWSEISSQIYYSEGYIKKLHGIALEILRKNVTKDY